MHPGGKYTLRFLFHSTRHGFLGHHAISHIAAISVPTTTEIAHIVAVIAHGEDTTDHMHHLEPTAIALEKG